MLSGTYNLSKASIADQQKLKAVKDEYSYVLDSFSLEYTHIKYHLQVGTIQQVQGWILHISVVRSQISALLEIIVPILIATKTSFKIVKNKETAKSLLDGDFGRSQVGKVITLYPESNEQAASLAKEIIKITTHFKGPSVLTDSYLGGTVYTRYGSFNPIIKTDDSGSTMNFIYNPQGQLVPDKYDIPYSPPNGFDWPFSELAIPVIPRIYKVFHEIYKPINVLKSDAKGNVIKSLYLKNNFFVKWCVIKQGKTNMWSDDAGRDIIDRLKWQKQIHEQLCNVIALPKILDFFTEDDGAHLVMEYIKGPSLFGCITKLNSKCYSWLELPLKRKLFILERILELIQIIEKLHRNGFVHRDITPVNFLVDNKNKLYLIDIELAYSSFKQIPDPPFEFGTNGFMSPEQRDLKTPTVKEDIYGLGATIITLLVGLPPVNFNTSTGKSLYEKLYFFIHDIEIAEVLTFCLDLDPTNRPCLKTIYNAVQKLKFSYQKSQPKQQIFTETPNTSKLQTIVNGAIKGLVTSPTVIINDLWQSRVHSKENLPDAQGKEFHKSFGLFEGISGVMYFLSRVRATGFNIDECQKAYDIGWAYIQAKCLSDLRTLTPGLYGGGAGIALTIASGLNSGLMENNTINRERIKKCLELPSFGLDVARGAAGQGIAALQCSEYVQEDELQKILKSYLNILLTSRQKKGNWITLQDMAGRKMPAASFSYGNSGIIWFLLEYAIRYKDQAIQKIAIQSLQSLIKLVSPFISLIKNKGFRKILDSPQTADGVTGIILILIKSYEITGTIVYRQLAEKMLASYPLSMVHENITQEVGLSGIGELYLEAYRVFKNKEWKERSAWIAQFFLHTSCKETEGSYYWLNNNSVFPTADFMIGNSGVIHFLTRYLTSGKLGYRLLR